uniref:C-type lectin domain-containing protein n=1 Tax=Sphenodon punctatus TaxID=8508 RepID=A0A8D0G7R7_SPHPU
ERALCDPKACILSSRDFGPLKYLFSNILFPSPTFGTNLATALSLLSNVGQSHREQSCLGKDCTLFSGECRRWKLYLHQLPDSFSPFFSGQVLTCCPAGWKRFQSSCYYFSDDQMNWNASEKNCTGMGSHLVVITTKAEQDYLFKSVNGTITSQPRNYCIGLAGRETENWWHWVDKTPLKDSAA